MNKFFVALCVLALVGMVVAAPEGDCEVCIGVIEKLEAGVKSAGVSGLDEMEAQYKKTCAELTHPKEKRLCWYLGAAKDSATYILREVSKPMSMVRLFETDLNAVFKVCV
jgi:hypothetical protein